MASAGEFRSPVAIPRQFGYELGDIGEAIMRHIVFVSTAVIAGLLSLPALAQQSLPRPPSQMPPPGAQQQQKQQQQQQGQKGAPQQQQQQQQQQAPVAPPAP